ncbi:MAG: aconitate hydratase AcnA [Actinobacteria bacterium]|uniref:(2R,3S)-2-methylisocitrate dehydratase n=1 Tax=freshwater metagenome TaxID=449393 RepID=A0A6J7GBC3_9ZZZZ|nr:aconitate hydratase AcnA [Actinomycetota bacterium]MTB28085.1 aconitate hydratase AcnA [Actinomycetota bacterium]
MDSFGARGKLQVGSKSYEIFRIATVPGSDRLPFTHKVLLENLLRTEDGANVTKETIAVVGSWDPAAEPSQEIQFTPARVVMQDFTGVPVVVDLATMREAVAELGGDASKIEPLAPSELVIDHSVIVDFFGSENAEALNVDLEYQRNLERYQFLRWGQSAFDEFKVVPPGTGIVHQVNIENLARVVMARNGQAYPDTVVGTDSHTTMVNGLGVLGWGVGGIEAEAAMLGQSVSMLIPRVVGFKLRGELPQGATSTDLVLTITEMLRQHGVVGKFVEFYGDGIAAIPLANRATIGNMSPEYGSTVAIFPIDDATLEYLRLTGRSKEQIDLVEAYAKEQGLWHDVANEPAYSEYLELDVSTVVASIAGPKRPQDRVLLSNSKGAFETALAEFTSSPATMAEIVIDGKALEIGHGAVTVAAITSCTNTSNPYVMIGAGMLAKRAVELGLTTAPWVKTSLAPGSKVVADYYDKAGLTPYLNKLGFNIVGYGCTTCIGNSGPLIPEVSAAVNEHDLAAVAVLSGNRNFEGRINPDIKMNYLASPPLVVAYAIAGTMDIDLATEPLGYDSNGKGVFLADVWPTANEVAQVVSTAIDADMFSSRYKDVFAGDERWQNLPTPSGDLFAWDPESTYVRKPPYFEGMGRTPSPVTDITGARALLVLGDSVTTDHISPAGNIRADSPAGKYLADHGVDRADFNSYGSRRGNHEVMIRGTFANIRLKNLMLDGVEGGFTVDLTDPDEPTVAIYDAAQAYAAHGTPLVILAGKEYGSGSSRDWAAKGTALLGVRVVIAESYERIHRSNLIGMGVLPLQYQAGVTAQALGLSGEETFTVKGVVELNDGTTPREVAVEAVKQDGTTIEFNALVRIDTPGEADYYRHGGILQYVLRSLL